MPASMTRSTVRFNSSTPGPLAQSDSRKSLTKCRTFCPCGTSLKSSSPFLRASTGSTCREEGLWDTSAWCNSSAERSLSRRSKTVVCRSESKKTRICWCEGAWAALRASCLICSRPISKEVSVGPFSAQWSPMLGVSSRMTTWVVPSVPGPVAPTKRATRKPASSTSRQRRARRMSCSMMRRRRLRFWDLRRNSIAAQRMRLKRMRLIRWIRMGELTRIPPATMYQGCRNISICADSPFQVLIEGSGPRQAGPLRARTVVRSLMRWCRNFARTASR